MRMSIDKLHTLFIGREDDGGVQVVEIDCSEWISKYPQLTSWRIEVTSPGGVVYMPIVTMVGDVLTWMISQSDTATKGKGMYQVVAEGANGARKTSDYPELIVLSTMPGTASETPPDPAKPWTDKVIEAAKRAEEAAKRAEEASGSIAADGRVLIEDKKTGKLYCLYVQDAKLMMEEVKE